MKKMLVDTWLSDLKCWSSYLHTHLLLFKTKKCLLKKKRKIWKKKKNCCLTCDVDFSRPLGRSIQNTLLGWLGMMHKVLFGYLEKLSNNLKNFWMVSFSDFHSFFHCHNDMLCFVLCTMFGTFFCSSLREKHTFLFTFVIINWI